MNDVMRSAAAVAMLAIVAACGGSDDALGPSLPVVASVDVVPGAVDMEAGDTLRFRATARSATGQALNGYAVTWSSDDPRVAMVSSTGLVTALRDGRASIMATIEKKTGSAKLTVTVPQTTPPNPVPRVSSLSPSSTRARGGGFTLTVSGGGFRPSSIVLWNGTPRATTHVSEGELKALIKAEDIASSGSAKVAVVTPAPGGGMSSELSFTIEAVVVTVAVGPGGAQQWPGEQHQLFATAKDDHGRDVVGRAVEWSSLSPQVASVDEVGLVTALSAGSAIIEATVDGVTGFAGVTVLPLPAFDLLYESFRAGLPELWILTPGHGAEPRRLLPPGTNATDPAVSRDGEWIAFVSNDMSLNRDIYVVKRDGSGLQRLTFDAANDDEPTWSPDGRQIAFRSDRSGFSDIWVMNADGSGQTNLLDTNYRPGNPYAERPAWSPKDGRIVFAFGDKSIQPFTMRLISIEPDGSDPRPVANTYSDTEPSFSRTGDMIALRRSYHPQPADQISVITADGVELITPFPIGPGYTPAWSPDDQWIAFSQPGNWPGVSRDLVLTRIGEPVRKLVTVGAALGGGANPTWIRR